MLRIKKQSV